MIDYKEKLMRLDQEAEKLVDNLARIKDNLVSVEEAKGELEITNGHLVSLIREMEVFHKDMQEAISSLKEINTETLLERLDYHVQETFHSMSSLVSDNQARIQELSAAVAAGRNEQMEFQSRISNIMGQVEKKNNIITILTGVIAVAVLVGFFV